MLELHLASLMKGNLRNPLSAMVLLCWHLIATFFVGGDNPDLPLCRRLLAPLIENYPNVGAPRKEMILKILGCNHIVYQGKTLFGERRRGQRHLFLQPFSQGPRHLSTVSSRMLLGIGVG